MMRNIDWLMVPFVVSGLLGAFAAGVIAPPAAAQPTLKNLVMHEAPRPVPTIDFADDHGQASRLAEFNGKVVVLNIWATWCVPCRKEMPALDRLQASLGGAEFAVAPISIDRGGVENVTKFYQEIGVHHLPIYLDASGKVLRELGAVGLPTTLILDRAGREIGRVVGPAEWDAPETMERLKSVIAKRGDETNGFNRAGDAPTQPGAAGAIERGVRWLKALLSE